MQCSDRIVTLHDLKLQSLIYNGYHEVEYTSYSVLSIGFDATSNAVLPRTQDI